MKIDMNWKETLDSEVKKRLDKQISETGKHRDSYLLAGNPGNAQLWCAIANLSMKLSDLEKSKKVKSKRVKTASRKKK